VNRNQWSVISNQKSRFFFLITDYRLLTPDPLIQAMSGIAGTIQPRPAIT